MPVEVLLQSPNLGQGTVKVWQIQPQQALIEIFAEDQRLETRG